MPVFAATFTPGISRFGFASVTTASIASVSLFAVSALNAVSITCGFVSGITERSLKRTRSTSVGFITLPSFAMAAAIIAFCNGVSTVSP